MAEEIDLDHAPRPLSLPFLGDYNGLPVVSCLAAPGEEYVVYRQRGGSITLDLSEAPGMFTLEWINPRTGARQDPTPLAGGARLMLPTPDANDWVLHVTRAP